MIEMPAQDSEDFTELDAAEAVEVYNEVIFAKTVASVGVPAIKFARKSFQGNDYIQVSFEEVEKPLTIKVMWENAQ